jgi:hypothetical protein
MGRRGQPLTPCARSRKPPRKYSVRPLSSRTSPLPPLHPMRVRCTCRHTYIKIFNARQTLSPDTFPTTRQVSTGPSGGFIWTRVPNLLSRLPNLLYLYGETPLMNCGPRSIFLYLYYHILQALFTFHKYYFTSPQTNISFHTVRLILCF